MTHNSLCNTGGPAHGKARDDMGTAGPSSTDIRLPSFCLWEAGDDRWTRKPPVTCTIAVSSTIHSTYSYSYISIQERERETLA